MDTAISMKGGRSRVDSPERSTEVGWTIIDRTERIIEPIEPTTDGPGGRDEPPPCFRLRRYGRQIFRQKSSNDQKIARMARILTIFGPFEPHRRQLQFPKISNERKIIESIESIDSIERSRDRSVPSEAAVINRPIDRIDRRPPYLFAFFRDLDVRVLAPRELLPGTTLPKFCALRA